MASQYQPTSDGPITVLVTLKIKPESVARALELWHEQIADIETTEPPGNIKYDLYENNEVPHEYTVVQAFNSNAIREAFMKKPKHEEISGKVFGEGLIDGEPVARYCSRVAGTKH